MQKVLAEGKERTRTNSSAAQPTTKMKLKKNEAWGDKDLDEAIKVLY
jgi:hypothetical protein